MPAPFVLLKCIGKAMLKHGLNALAGGLPLGDVLIDVADAVMNDWKKEKQEQERRVELQALAQAATQEVGRQAAQVVSEFAADQPPEVRQALADYLLQVPAAISRSLRRPADPTGTTVPAGLHLRKAEDLVPFLPAQLPRFKRGDRPAGIGDWELVDLLGIGGFGEVWKARNPHLPSDPPVALKFCLDPVAANSLRNEAALLARVKREGKDPGIVELRHTYLSADPPCLEYEYVEGGDLAGLIQEWHSEGRPTPFQAASLMLGLAKIVAVTHRLRPPLVHRDLKPANILVQRQANGRCRLKVADFGIGGLVASQVLRQATRPATSAVLLATVARGSCTPLYASPQQVRGEPPDPRDDVHALGVIWYQLLTGDLGSGVPGGLHWLKELQRHGMSEAMIHLLASCFEAQPANRPANAAALAEQMQALLLERYFGLSGKPDAAVLAEQMQALLRLETSRPPNDFPLPQPEEVPFALPAPPPEQPGRPSRALRMGTLVVCLLVLAALLGAGVLGWQFLKPLTPAGPGQEARDKRRTLSAEELARLSPEEQVRQTVKFSSRKIPNPEKEQFNQRFKCLLRIVAPDQVLNEIDQVTYDFGATGKKWFASEKFTQLNRLEGFEMAYYTDVGHCNWEMDVVLELRNGKRVTLKCNMYEVRQD